MIIKVVWKNGGQLSFFFARLNRMKQNKQASEVCKFYRLFLFLLMTDENSHNGLTPANDSCLSKFNWPVHRPLIFPSIVADGVKKIIQAQAQVLARRNKNRHNHITTAHMVKPPMLGVTTFLTCVFFFTISFS